MANLRGGSFSTYGGEQNVNTGRGYQLNNSAFNGDTINIGVQGSNEEPRAQRKTGFLQALNSLPDYDTRKDRNTRPALGTCKWFLSHKLFQEWKASEGSSLLWVSADPGCGKSVLAKHLIDSMSSILNDTAVTVCYFFFKDDFEDQSDLAGALRCILYQIFMQNDQLVTDKLLQQFDVERQLLTTSFEKLWAMFKNAVCDANCGEIVCILDAVDECKEQQLPQLAEKLGEIFADNGAIRGSHLKVILTSRPYARIDHNLTRSMPLIHLSGESETEIREISGEIDLVIKDRVRTLVKTRNLYPQVEHLLLGRLLSVSNRTYLWAHLTLNMVEESDFNSGETIEATIARVTSRIPRTVDDAYERILANSSNREAATQLLQVVIAAVRPLTLWEMDIALHMIRGDTSSIMVDNVAKRTHHELQQYIRGLCGLFVAVIESKIYLLHQTAKEFLVQPPEDHKPRRQGKGNFTWKRSLETRASHHTLSKSCIRHLFSLESEFTARRSDEGVSPSQLMERHVFLDYSAKHWAHHVRELTRKAQKEMIQDSLRLCQENSRLFERWFLVYWTQTLTRRPKQLNPLIVAAILGLEAVVTYLLKRGGIALKRKDRTYGRSALSWAAGNGFHPVVRVLISGTTVFSKAAYALLGKKKVLIHSRDKHDLTPLSHAVLNGHQAVVETLINAGARLDALDLQGGTPMLYAICRKQQGIIDLFTRQGAPGAVKSVDDVRNPILLSAARNGNETVVLMLLEATSNTGGIVTRRVLEAAAGSLRMETVDVLLAARKEGVNIDENVLNEAASNLDPRVLMLFLTHRDACRLTERVAEIGARAKTPEAMAHILERGGEGIITNKVIMTAVRRRKNGVLEFLVNQLGTSPPVFQDVMGEMAGSKVHCHYYLDVMGMLLKARGKPVSISEAVLVAAAQNPNSWGMMELVLDIEDRPIPITERVLKAAAGNRGRGWYSLHLLYEAKGEPVVVTNDVIVAALRTLLVSGQAAVDDMELSQPLGALQAIMESQSHVSIGKDVLSAATAVAGLDLIKSGNHRDIALDFVDKLIAWEAVGKVTFTFEGGRSEALAVLETLKDSVRHRRD